MPPTPIDLFLPLFGAHMAHNAALAVAAVETFRGGALSGEVLYDGLSNALARPGSSRWPGSGDRVGPPTTHGVAATLAGLREAFTAQPLIGVVAMMRDKAVDEVLDLLADELDTIVVTSMPDISRALPLEELAELASDSFDVGGCTPHPRRRPSMWRVDWPSRLVRSPSCW